MFFRNFGLTEENDEPNAGQDTNAFGMDDDLGLLLYSCSYCVDLSDEDVSISGDLNNVNQERSESSRLFELQNQIDQHNYTIELKSEEIRRLTSRNKDFESEVKIYSFIII